MKTNQEFFVDDELADAGVWNVMRWVGQRCALVSRHDNAASSQKECDELNAKEAKR